MKGMNPLYCSSLANPAASYGECARWSIFNFTWKFFTISNTGTKVRVRARFLVDGRNCLKTIDYNRVAISLALLLLNGYWSEKSGHQILFIAIHGQAF
jgi:hypothetical protein